MGYDLHITRRKHWSDAGDDITADEWLTCVRGDAELRLRPENGFYFAEWSGLVEHGGHWLDWRDGQIYSKNPDRTLMDKMVEIALQLGAEVQGDDGEVYTGSDEAPQHRASSLGDRIVRWFARFRPRSAIRTAQAPIPFGVGDRVRDPWGNEHTILAIDREAEHGMGVIRTRRDDGTELGFAVIAHGLTPITKMNEP